jgi:hypothetical protein
MKWLIKRNPSPKKKKNEKKEKKSSAEERPRQVHQGRELTMPPRRALWRLISM